LTGLEIVEDAAELGVDVGLGRGFAGINSGASAVIVIV
jgi:hypothetical protein